jgi:hypothetical protein
MLDLDITVLRRDGKLRRLTGEEFEGVLNLPMMSEELYRSARWLRVFVARPVQLARREVLALVHLPGETAHQRVQAGASLLGR